MNVLLKLPRKYEQMYNVEIKTYNNALHSSQNILRYINTISLKKETIKGYSIRIHRSDVRLNDTKDQTPVNDVVLIAGKVLHDLELKVSQYGQIYKINNFKEIQKKWEETKFIIESNYKGNIVKKMIESMNLTIINKDTLINSLDKDPFIFNYLKGIYGEYENDVCEFKQNIYALSSKSSISINKSCRMQKLSDGKYDISATSSLTDESIHMLNKELKEKYGEGSVDTEIEHYYTMSSERNIEKLKLKQRLFWNSQTIKSMELNVSLK